MNALAHLARSYLLRSQAFKAEADYYRADGTLTRARQAALIEHCETMAAHWADMAAQTESEYAEAA